LVIIWLKRCLARSLIDPPLESEPVGVGVGVGAGDADGVGEGLGEGLGEGDGLGEGEGLGEAEGLGEGEGLGEAEGLGLGQSHSLQSQLLNALEFTASDPALCCADAGDGCICTSTSQVEAVSAADAKKLRANFVIVSARTACRWDRCRHRREV
jgi:hypothetical protein